jgi:hypothetical protein
MPEQIPLPMDAGRVCDAIAKIGYSPASALMDITDNSITANATKVVVEIDTDPDKTYASKNNVTAYRVIDNGKGMNDDEILNALKLGASAEYEADSLSKYGMGLKSAGFSLGTRIKIISKKNGVYSSVNYVDRYEIREAGNYVVSRHALTPEDVELGSKISEFESGTIVEVTGCHHVNQDSAKKTIDTLSKRLGVVYYEFLRQTDNLAITLKCTGKPDVRVVPMDILFSEIAQNDFNPDTYDYKSPYRVLRETVDLSDHGVEAPLIMEAVIFPRDDMKSYPHFSEDERDQIKKYEVGAKNKGFFIYRNKRLIRWGDDLEIVTKDDLNFRARIVLHTAHDEAFHVDVSKQRMAIPEDVHEKIRRLTSEPRRQASDAMKLCTQLLKKSNDVEGSSFNYRNQDLVEEEIEEVTGEGKQTEVRERKEKLVIETEELEKEEREEQKEPIDEVVEEIPVFERVRYSDKVSTMTVWEPGYDPVDGTYVRINRNHSFYQTILSRLDDGDEARQAMEAIFWSCAAAQNKTFQSLTDVDEDAIRTVLDRFKKLFAMNLDSWCLTNQDLYDND